MLVFTQYQAKRRLRIGKHKKMVKEKEGEITC